MSAQIKVLREPSTKEYTLSEFFIEDIRYGVGIEDEHRDEKKFGETRIPNGTYEIELTDSPKFSKEYFVDAEGYLSRTKSPRFNKPHQLITLKNVPNFSRVLWHWGNTDLDTDACYIVGSYHGSMKVKRNGKEEMTMASLASRVKYLEIYPIIFQMIRKNNREGKKTFVSYADKIKP